MKVLNILEDYIKLMSASAQCKGEVNLFLFGVEAHYTVESGSAWKLNKMWFWEQWMKRCLNEYFI